MKKNKEYYKNSLFDSHSHCEGFDVFNYINGWTPTSLDVNNLARIIHKSKIDYAITSPIPSTIYYTASSYLNTNNYIASGICDYPYEIENQRLLLSIHNLGYKNLLPFLSFSLNECVEKQIEALNKQIETYDVYGLKYHTQTDRNPATMVENYPQLISLLLENNIPILFHTGNSNVASPVEVLVLAEKHPNIRMCVAHFARFRKDFFDRYDPVVHRNVFLDIAPTDYLYKSICETDISYLNLSIDLSGKKEMIESIYRCFPNNIIWGSDIPWIDSRSIYKTTEDTIAYEDVVATLFECDDVIVNKIANVNTLRFLFG